MEESHCACEQNNDRDNAIESQAGAEKSRELILVFGGYEFRRVLHNRRSNSKVEESVITGKYEYQNPQAECLIAKPVEDKWREKEAYNRMHQKAEPGCANIFNGLQRQAHGRSHIRRNPPHSRAIQPFPTRYLVEISQRSQRMKQASLEQKLAFPPGRVQQQRGFIFYRRNHA